MSLLQDYIIQYGYFIVFVFLSLGIFGLPMPDEVVIIFTGYLSSSGLLSLASALLIAIVGVFIGTLVTYTIGKKIGRPIIERFGKWIGLSEKRVGRVERWFSRYGSWTVTLGFFVPGMRHFVCCFSGISGMNVQRYMLFSSLGTVVSGILCVSLGYLFGWPF
ncbi:MULTISPECIES: DedA family protein [Sporosarcina]|uniref:DedA family protein n=1 Tax=Sporosarcina TaxID=1569 RepID=UPI00058DB07C|nr:MULTISPECIES: DedA family protein [Sporosarcina]WJY28012.1 DedA family protein [Sporosarcina sp. 0.2-SM1T-5]